MDPATRLFADILNSGSFLSLWYWIFLAVLWAQLSYFTLGVGYHDVRQAAREGGQNMKDIETIVDINLKNTLASLREYGSVLVGVAMFFLFFSRKNIAIAQCLFPRARYVSL